MQPKNLCLLTEKKKARYCIQAVFGYITNDDIIGMFERELLELEMLLTAFLFGLRLVNGAILLSNRTPTV